MSTQCGLAYYLAGVYIRIGNQSLHEIGSAKDFTTALHRRIGQQFCKVNIRRSGVGYYLRGEETGPVGFCLLALNVYLYML